MSTSIELSDFARAMRFDAVIGWPDKLALENVARLMAWDQLARMDELCLEARRWYDFLRLDAKLGLLESLWVEDSLGAMDTWRYQNSEYFEGGRRLIAHPNTGYVVTAAQVMAWLELKGNSPLEFAKHFRAWLKAKGVFQEVERLAPKQMLPSLKAEEPPRKRDVMVRRALVDKLRVKWPTIEHDLRESSRNGLKMAKVQGGWDVEKACEWAVTRGKLRQDQPQPSGFFGSTIHRIRKGEA